jgi:hypothetical protein
MVVDAPAEMLPARNASEGEPSLAELKRQAVAMIEATVASVNTRPSTSRKRI